MEFNFNIEKLLGPASKQGIVFLSGEDEFKYSYEDLKNINILLDKIGKLSAQVRHLSIIYISL
jgi:hypothetical protein